MAIKVTGLDGQDPIEVARERLARLLERLRRCSRPIQDGLLWSVRNHFKTIYPGSKHYDPEKVQPLEKRDGGAPTGSVEIDVPGVTRAYRNLVIRPRFRKYLAIPIHRSSYAKSPKDFGDLIFIKKKDGGKLLAQKTPGGLAFLFALKERVFQRRNPGLMPSDKVLADNVFARIKAYLATAK